MRDDRERWLDIPVVENDLPTLYDQIKRILDE
jgi:hypothetical protein